MKQVEFNVRPFLMFLLITAGLFFFAFSLNAAGNLESGKKTYDRNCMECHHKDGMGILAPPFAESTRFKSMDGVVALIDYIMPATSPDLCTGDRAEDVAAYIIEEFKFKVPTAPMFSGTSPYCANRLSRPTAIAAIRVFWIRRLPLTGES